MQKTRKTVIFAAFVFYARRLTSFILTVISYRGRQKKWDFFIQGVPTNIGYEFSKKSQIHQRRKIRESWLTFWLNNADNPLI